MEIWKHLKRKLVKEQMLVLKVIVSRESIMPKVLKYK